MVARKQRRQMRRKGGTEYTAWKEKKQSYRRQSREERAVVQNAVHRKRRESHSIQPMGKFSPITAQENKREEMFHDIQWRERIWGKRRNGQNIPLSGVTVHVPPNGGRFTWKRHSAVPLADPGVLACTLSWCHCPPLRRKGSIRIHFSDAPGSNATVFNSHLQNTKYLKHEPRHYVINKYAFSKYNYVN